MSYCVVFCVCVVLIGRREVGERVDWMEVGRDIGRNGGKGEKEKEERG